MNKYALFTDQLGRRIKTAVEHSDKVPAPPPAENKAGLLAGHTSPVEITDACRQFV